MGSHHIILSNFFNNGTIAYYIAIYTDINEYCKTPESHIIFECAGRATKKMHFYLLKKSAIKLVILISDQGRPK